MWNRLQGTSLSQIILVTGTGIASAKLQLWESSGLCSIPPMKASDVERLGAAWISAAGAAVAAHGLEVCPAMAIDRAFQGFEWHCMMPSSRLIVAGGLVRG